MFVLNNSSGNSLFKIAISKGQKCWAPSLRRAKTSASLCLLYKHLISKKGQFHRLKSYLNTFLWSVLTLALNSETENPDIQWGYFVTDFGGGQGILMFVYINPLSICNEWGQYIWDFFKLQFATPLKVILLLSVKSLSSDDSVHKDDYVE